MYEAFYGLRERPFELTPNPSYLLLTDKHREALCNLEYGITARKGITLLLGDAGTGKTTLIRTAAARAATGGSELHIWAHLRNPTLSRSEFLEFLVASFRLSPAAAASKTRLLDELERLLVDGLHAALFVDEAQSVSKEILEELRLLANIESDTDKLMPLVLVGQPELADRLNEPDLRQLKQRVALRCVLPALSLHESAAYIAARIETAGGNPAEVFSRDAVVAIYDYSAGIPRTINVICDNALLTGYAEDQRPVDVSVVDAVCRDFDLSRRAVNVSALEARRPSARPEPLRGRRWTVESAFTNAAVLGRWARGNS